MTRLWSVLVVLLAVVTFSSGCAIPVVGVNYAGNDGYETGFYTGAPVRWGDNSPTFFIASDSFPPEIQNKMQNGILNGFKQFNKNPSNLEFRPSISDTPMTDVGTGNGRSEIYFANESTVAQLMHPDGTKAIAAAFVVTDPFGIMRECDVILAPDAEWTDSFDEGELVPATGRHPSSIASAVLHELGHCAGLAHQTEVMGAMGHDETHFYRNGNNRLPYIGSNEGAQLGQLYGYNPAKNDLFVTDRKYSGSSLNHGGTAEYSQTTYQPILDMNGKEPLAVANNSDRLRYFLELGKEYQVAATYENLRQPGQTPFNVPAAFVLSKDRTLQSDQVYPLTTEMIDLTDAAYPHTKQTRITIPTDIDCGAWYLGIILDPLHEITQIVDATDPTTNPHALVMPIGVTNSEHGEPRIDKAEAFIRHFGDPNKVKTATVEELMEVDGMTKNDALSIWDWYHPQW